MCRKVKCSQCGKATWTGCGLHITYALQGVDEGDRCPNWQKGCFYPCNGGGEGDSSAVTEDSGGKGTGVANDSSCQTF